MNKAKITNDVNFISVDLILFKELVDYEIGGGGSIALLSYFIWTNKDIRYQLHLDIYAFDKLSQHANQLRTIDFRNQLNFQI